jgi:hypothetical protein
MGNLSPYLRILNVSQIFSIIKFIIKLKDHIPNYSNFYIQDKIIRIKEFENKSHNAIHYNFTYNLAPLV